MAGWRQISLYPENSPQDICNVAIITPALLNMLWTILLSPARSDKRMVQFTLSTQDLTFLKGYGYVKLQIYANKHSQQSYQWI